MVEIYEPDDPRTRGWYGPLGKRQARPRLLDARTAWGLYREGKTNR